MVIITMSPMFGLDGRAESSKAILCVENVLAGN
jgi:hypothetical protein